MALQDRSLVCGGKQSEFTEMRVKCGKQKNLRR